MRLVFRARRLRRREPLPAGFHFAHVARQALDIRRERELREDALCREHAANLRANDAAARADRLLGYAMQLWGEVIGERRNRAASRIRALRRRC